jgi:hypothetical protein
MSPGARGRVRIPVIGAWLGLEQASGKFRPLQKG